MSDYTAIDVAELAHAQAVVKGTGAADEGGLMQWRPAAAAPATAPLRIVDETNNADWFNYVNNLTALVPALGCRELLDVRLQKHGVLFHGDAHISDESHLGSVATAETQEAGGASATTEVIVSDRPGIIFVGPGIRVFGHWLVDFIPRLRIAQNVLGNEFDDFVIPLPLGTPAWALNMMRELCGVTDQNLVWFDPIAQTLEFRSVISPTYGHSSYHFHPAVADFWPQSKANGSGRRLCISRVNYEGHTDGVLKSFANRALFEEMAVSHGYELVYPERLSLQEQISLFDGASHVMGEYGSALHNTLFTPPGAVVGAIRCPNDVQLRISALRDQTTVLLLPAQEWIDDRGGQAYAVDSNSIEAFIKAMDS